MRLALLWATTRDGLSGEGRGLLDATAGRTIELSRTERCRVDPGAVGRARNGEPLARYAQLDLERQNVTRWIEHLKRTWTRFRVRLREQRRDPQ